MSETVSGKRGLDGGPKGFPFRRHNGQARIYSSIRAKAGTKTVEGKNFRGALDVRWGLVYCVLNRAVGETFRSVVCWGEDSEPH